MIPKSGYRFSEKIMLNKRPHSAVRDTLTFRAVRRVTFNPRREPSQSMPAAVQTMLDVLNLERLEVNLFRGRSPQDRWQREFARQAIGQALAAALRTRG